MDIINNDQNWNFDNIFDIPIDDNTLAPDLTPKTLPDQAASAGLFLCELAAELDAARKSRVANERHIEELTAKVTVLAERLDQLERKAEGHDKLEAKLEEAIESSAAKTEDIIGLAEQVERLNDATAKTGLRSLEAQVFLENLQPFLFSLRDQFKKHMLTSHPHCPLESPVLPNFPRETSSGS